MTKACFVPFLSIGLPHLPRGHSLSMHLSELLIWVMKCSISTNLVSSFSSRTRVLLGARRARLVVVMTVETRCRRYGAGKWRMIQKDPELAPALDTRSNVDLKVRSRQPLPCPADWTVDGADLPRQLHGARQHPLKTTRS